MDSDLQQQQLSHNFQFPKQQMNPGGGGGGGGGGLTRYRSAPSSYFSAFMDAVDTTTAEFSQPQNQPQSQQPRPLSPETESLLARFMQSVDEDGTGAALRPHKLYDIPENSPLTQQSQFMGSVKQETEPIQRLPTSSQMSFPTSQANSNPMDASFRLPSSVAVDFSASPLKLNCRINSNLTRHRSSPAGLFDDIIVENGILVNREPGTGNYGSGSRSNRNGQINFASGESPIFAGNSTGGGGSRRFGNGGDERFATNFQAGSWDDQSLFADQFPGQEMVGGDIDSPENQNREGRNRPPGMLTHHLSLPSPSIEKLMQFQDAVPCKIRAKRGCATHPRSIAERVRRTKISERMRKLQDLVPNMDKQTNTSDMLDLAVEYIKDLQKQVKTLGSNRDKCTCSSSVESGRR